MSGDIFMSLRRTVVPYIVGAILAYLASRWNIVITEESMTELVTALFGVGYYSLVRVLEAKVDERFGILLGGKTMPDYTGTGGGGGNPPPLHQ